jgi:hypothetical protein
MEEDRSTNRRILLKQPEKTWYENVKGYSRVSGLALLSHL